jgi:uncharacterized protein (TIGR03382 family)
MAAGNGNPSLFALLLALLFALLLMARRTALRSCGVAHAEGEFEENKKVKMLLSV